MTSKIAILTMGSRGDVQPFVALARGLQAAGFRVTLAAGENFAEYVRNHGVEFAPLRADLQALIASKEGRELLSGSPVQRLRGLKNVILPMVRRSLDDAWAAARDAEAILYHPKVLSGRHIAEKTGAPCLLAAAVPILSPTRAFPIPMIPYLPLGGAVNRLSYSLLRFVTAPYRSTINRWRREVLQLPAEGRLANDVELRGQPMPVLYGFSPHVVPPPPDWSENMVVTGYWFLDHAGEWQPPANLAAFLDAGPPPVYVGFGSMVGQDPERLTRTVLGALRQAGQRGVLTLGWGGLAKPEPSESVLAIESVPHDWLFPRMAAVVHHGGAGTVAAGLRAGKPTVVCPFLGDQPFWGRVVCERGVGPRPISLQRLTVDGLAEAIRTAATDELMRRRSMVLGESIRAEDGVGRAVEWIHQYLSGHRR